METEEAGDQEMGHAAHHDTDHAAPGDVHDHVKIGTHEAKIGTQSDTHEARGTSNEARGQEGLEEGARVKIHSLERLPDLNGVEGEVLSFNPSTGRWNVVTLPHSRTVAIGADHLTVLPTAERGGGGGAEGLSPGHMGHTGLEQTAEQDDAGLNAVAEASRDSRGTALHSRTTGGEPLPSPAAEPAVLRTSTDVDQVA